MFKPHDFLAILFYIDSLQPFVNEIVNTIDVDFILPLMVQRGLLTADQIQYFYSPYHTSRTKQQKLCVILTGLPEDCVDNFIQCLHETSSFHPHWLLYDKLCESRQC